MPRLSHEKGFREVATLTALTLGGIALPQPASAAEMSRNSAAPIELFAPRHEAGKPLPKEILAILNKISTPETPINKIAQLSPQEIARFQLGKMLVRVYTAGNKSQNIEEEYISEYRRSLELLDQFAETRPNLSVPVIELDPLNQQRDRRQVHAGVSPVNKDIALFLVPSRINLGQGPDGKPITFTQADYNTVVSVVRPDLLQSRLGLNTEACQATLNVDLSMLDFSGIDPQRLAYAVRLPQEALCVSLGAVLFARSSGWSFNKYVARASQQTLLATHKATPGYNAFAVSIPYINDKKLYSGLTNAIPKYVTKALVYPGL